MLGVHLVEERGDDPVSAHPAPVVPVAAKPARAQAPRAAAQGEFQFAEQDVETAAACVYYPGVVQLTEAPPPVLPTQQALAHVKSKRLEAEGLDESEIAPPASYRGRSRFSALLNVGKFLSLNGAVDGTPAEPRRLKLPRGHYTPRLSLWNESDYARAGFVRQDLGFPPRDLTSHGPRRAVGNLLFK